MWAQSGSQEYVWCPQNSPPDRAIGVSETGNRAATEIVHETGELRGGVIEEATVPLERVMLVRRDSASSTREGLMDGGLGSDSQGDQVRLQSLIRILQFK